MDALKVYVRGAKCLSRKAAPAPPGPADARLRALADAMLATMRAYDGIGLAAPQVGESVRMIVLDLAMPKEGPSSPGEALLLPRMPMAMLNPVALPAGGKELAAEEGCLSVPSIYASVIRPCEIHLEFTWMDGRRESTLCAGWLARAIQHEIDHLDGILFVDRLSTRESRRIKGDLEKLRSLSAPAGFIRPEPEHGSQT